MEGFTFPFCKLVKVSDSFNQGQGLESSERHFKIVKKSLVCDASQKVKFGTLHKKVPNSIVFGKAPGSFKMKRRGGPRDLNET